MRQHRRHRRELAQKKLVSLPSRNEAARNWRPGHTHTETNAGIEIARASDIVDAWHDERMQKAREGMGKGKKPGPGGESRNPHARIVKEILREKSAREIL
jgi:hypothetical protein